MYTVLTAIIHALIWLRRKTYFPSKPNPVVAWDMLHRLVDNLEDTKFYIAEIFVNDPKGFTPHKEFAAFFDRGVYNLYSARDELKIYNDLQKERTNDEKRRASKNR